jgi:nicotinamidase/pyrazinamidase
MKVLVVVDMQNDFIDGSLGSVEAQKIVPKVKEKIHEYIQHGDKVLFTQDTHAEDYLQTQEGRNLPVKHCIKGTQGWQIQADVVVPDAERFEKKAFGSIELAQAIAEMTQVESVELIGLCTDICVISNAMILKARLPEIPVTVDASCCAGTTVENHRNALNAMRMCQVIVKE